MSEKENQRIEDDELETETEESEKDNNQKNKKDYQPKKNWVLELIISSIVLVLLTFFAGLISINVSDLDLVNETYRVLGDSFFISGILCVCFWVLTWLSSEGAFDAIIYGTKRFFTFIFRIHPEKSKLPKTYYDYVTAKHGKKPNRIYIFLAVSTVFLIIGIVLSIISNFQS